MDLFLTVWQWARHLAPVGVGDILVGALAALLLFMLLTWPRRRPGLGPVHLGRGAGPAVTMRDPLLLRLATWLFRPWLIHLGGWYRPGQRRKMQDQLLWVGLEQTSVGAWVAFRLLLLAAGVLTGAAWGFLLHLGPGLTLFGGLASGLSFAWLPQIWLHDRLKRRDGVMLQQLVPWLRSVASLVRSGTPTRIALRQATDNLRRSSVWPALPAGMTDLYAEVERMQARMWTGQISDAEALEELAARCPQVDVNEAVEELRLALLTGGNLAEALERSASIAQATIAAALRGALERRLPEVTALTVVAAFGLYVGSIGVTIAIGIVQGLSGLH